MSISLLRTNEEIADIYSKYVDTVYRICFMMLKNIPETEDATQTVFIRLINCKKQFYCDEHLKAWLIVTSQNVCKDMLKSCWRSRQVDIESIAEASYINDAPCNDLLEQVMGLPTKYKLPAYLYYYESYSTEEISKILKINPSTLRTHLRIARQKLKLLLEEEY